VLTFCKKMWAVGIIVVLCFSIGISAPLDAISLQSCPVTNLTGTSGYIKSQNFPNKYSNQIDCVTIIIVEEGQHVQLIFYAFETELGADIVTIYDGFGTGMTEIYQLSGTDPVHKVYKTSSSNIMTLRFKTDLDHTFSGYYGFYQSISPSKQGPALRNCPQPNIFSDEFGVIVSPNWPELYPNQEFCSYKIRLSSEYIGIKIRVNFFDTELDADVVSIYQGREESRSNLVKLMSGQYDSGFTVDVKGSDATIVFISDLDNRYPGFSLTYVGRTTTN